MSLDLISKLVDEFSEGKDIFPVEVKMTSGKILVAIDKPSGITIEECAALSRFLYKRLEESSIFDKHELEVGSPGMDQPLKVYKQYLRRIGRTIRVVTNTGDVLQGTLSSANENTFEIVETIVEKEGKKKIKKEKLTTLALSDIKETRLELKFNK